MLKLLTTLGTPILEPNLQKNRTGKMSNFAVDVFCFEVLKHI